MITTYTDPIAYRRSTTGQETKTLIGNLLRLSSGISEGATSLPVPALIVAQSIDDQVTIFDGSNSEIVTVTAPASIGATSISVSATVASHAAKVIIATDGPQGSLAEMIIEASAWLETITEQPRWLATYSNETLQAPSMRAAMDRNGALMLRPRRFPVTSVTSASVLNNAVSQALNVSNAQIADDGQLIMIPSIVTLGGSGFPQLAPLTRTMRAQITLTYSAGYSVLPPYITSAANCLVGALLSDRQNPTGSAETQLGDKHLVTQIRGDNTGKGALVKRAESLLHKEIQKNF